MWVAAVLVLLLMLLVGAHGDGTKAELQGEALQRRVEELCVRHCEGLLRDASMCTASGSGFCRFVRHLSEETHLADMAAALRRVRPTGESGATVLDWALKDLVNAKHTSKTEDDHAMVLALMEHVTEVVGAMLAFHEHSESL